MATFALPRTVPRRGDDDAQVPAPGERDLVEIFRATASVDPTAVALETSDVTLNYRELAAAASGLASRLRAWGIGPGDRVGVRLASGSADLYIAVLGVLHAGAAYVPVDADDPPVRAEHAWGAATVCAVVGDGLVVTRRQQGTGIARSLRPRDDAWVIFTSGSTGEPKAVAVTHRSAAAFVDAETQLWSVGPHDRVLAGLSVGFDASCEEMWLAWRNGAALVPAPRALVRSGIELGPWLSERRISVISTVPTLAAMWETAALAGVRLLILGGEACPPELGWRLAEGREVWNTYGPTEATVVSTAARVRPGRSVTIGSPLRGWEIAVLGEGSELVAPGDTGELVISGVGLGRYLDPELDRERYAPLPALGWTRAYRTGDMVRETPEGLAFVGRCDGQVKIGGRRIELAELEAHLRAVPGVRAAAAALRSSVTGNPVLVGYVVGDATIDVVRNEVLAHLPDGIAPLIVALEELPTRSSGKVDRAALPWPPTGANTAADRDGFATATERWLAERWADQLGPLVFERNSDFFAVGGSSLAAAKLVSALRERFPCAAVADLYSYRRLGDLAERLDSLDATRSGANVERKRPGADTVAAQLVGVAALLVLQAPRWLVAIFALSDWFHGPGPQVGWLWLALAWLAFVSVPGKAAIVLTARRTLLGRLKPGRYSRASLLTCRLWFVERLAEIYHLNFAAGTPWAPRYARWCGVTVGAGAQLGTLPSPSGLIWIGDGATLEANVDLHTWWIDGSEVVVGPITVGAGARIGARSLLMPGADVGIGAEIEPGSVVTGSVPAFERWAGSPARQVGEAGDDWPHEPAPGARRVRGWHGVYALGLALQSALPVLAALPALGVAYMLSSGTHSLGSMLIGAIEVAPLVAACFIVSYALLVALLVRAVSPLVRSGWQTDSGATRWALWFSELLWDSSKIALFPLYMSLLTRSWLRLAGVRVGPRTELSHAVGFSKLVRVADTSFGADDVTFNTARARHGWMHVAPIEVGARTFLGNSAIVEGGAWLGNDCLLGVLSVSLRETCDGTSWFGAPPLELPRVPDRPDPTRTVDPSRRVIAARAATEVVRILLPTSVSICLAAGVYFAIETAGRIGGLWAMIAATPGVIGGAGLLAVVFTIAAKWAIMGRYRVCEHPFWSWFVWRDEIVNSCQEQLAGGWFLTMVLATPLMAWYLRAMGARVGADVWFETLNVTEFDLVDLEEGCAINRHAHIETHLVHDRLMRLGPTRFHTGSTLGPSSAVLPDTALGARSTVGGRSVVMRGEQLPAGSRWHGAPVTAA